MKKILPLLLGLLFITNVSSRANPPLLLKNQELIYQQLSAWKAHFPDLKIEDFQLENTDTMMQQKGEINEWGSYLDNYEDFFYYAPDREKFIDLFSVGRAVEKVNGNYYARFEPYQAVLLGMLNEKQKEVYPIAFCSRNCSFEEVLWMNDNELFIAGNDINEEREEKVKPVILYVNIKDRKLEKYINTNPKCFNTVIYQGARYELINYDQGAMSKINAETILTDEFEDSTRIGKAGQFKIELQQKTLANENAIVHYTLYKKHNGKWTAMQKDSLFKMADLPMLPLIEDYNNDGYADVSVTYEASGNGANGIRLLLLFDPAKNRLQTVKNATNYSNLAYNPKLNCITSLSVYGNNSTTMFLNLKNNTLVEKAMVHFDGETIESYSIKNGIQTLIEKKTYQGEPTPYIRFTNFKPIKE